MLNQQDLEQFQTLLEPAQKILILAGEKPDLDSLGSSLALYLALLRLGKIVNIACPDLPTVGFSRLVGVDKVQSDLGGQNLVVSFPYTEGSIEKVSYNIEGDKFNLVIQPRAGSQTLSPGAVKFSQAGTDADLILILGARNLGDLGSFYEKEKDLLGKIPLVVIDRHPDNAFYGRVNLVSTSASSVSEIIGLILTRMGIELDSDIASNLLAGIDFATQKFSLPQTTADAFEITAHCLKAGAQRKTAPNIPVTEEKVSVKPRVKIPLQTLSRNVKDLNQEEAPPDWLTPKIFKGSTLT